MPTTGARDAIEVAFRHDERDAGRDAVPGRFIGMEQGAAAVSGMAVCAEQLGILLNGRVQQAKPVLVIPTLVPSWAVAFPRFSAIIAELGGDLRHASVLLREEGIPFVDNDLGSFRAIAEGDRVRADPAPGRGRHRVQPRDAAASDGTGLKHRWIIAPDHVSVFRPRPLFHGG